MSAVLDAVIDLEHQLRRIAQLQALAQLVPQPAPRGFEAAAEYLAEHPGCRAVLSGGQGPDEGISEAECMYRWLTDAGIEPGRLLLEDRSTNTAENLQNSAAVIESEDAAGRKLSELKIVLCSAEYHLCRARLLSQKIIGIDPGTLPAPTPRPVLRLTYFMREACGLMVQDLYL